jgi:cell division protein FtsX
MLEKKMERMTERDRETLDWLKPSMAWYGWGSPVGLGLFALLIAAAVALIRFAFR